MNVLRLSRLFLLPAAVVPACAALLCGTAFAAPADFNAIPGYGGEIPNLTVAKNDVAIENITLVSETTDTDGRKRLSFTGRLNNTGKGYFQSAQIRFETPVAGSAWDVQIVDDDALIVDLPPNSSAPLPEPIVLMAAADKAETVKAQVLAGQHLRARALELFQFRLPPVAVDEATDEAFDSAVVFPPPFQNQVQLHFSATTPLLAALQPGRLLMETTVTDPVDRSFNNDGSLRGLARHVSAEQRFAPVQIGIIRTTRMVEVTGVTINQDGTVVVSGKQFGGEPEGFDPLDPFLNFGDVQTDPRFRGFIDNLVEGTIVVTAKDAFDPPGPGQFTRDPFNPPLGTTMFTDSGTVKRQQELSNLRAEKRVRHPRISDVGGFFVMHLPVNDFKITKGLYLDGQVVLDGLVVDIETRFSLGVLKRISLQLTSKIEMNLRLTAGPGAGNEDKPLIEKEKQLASIPGPAIYFSIGSVPIKVQPVFQVKAGVTLDVPMEVVIPFTGSYEAGMQMVWDGTRLPGQQVTFEPVSEVRPLAISKPRLADSLAMEASAWMEAQLSVIVNDTVGPYIGSRVTASFLLAPLQDPWWDMNAKLDVTGGFKLKFLGVELAEVGGPVFQGPELFRRQAPGTAPGGRGVPGGSPPGPHDPVEGGNIRWAKVHINAPEPFGARVAKVVGSAEDVFAVIESFAVTPPVCRLDANGEVLWSVGSFLVAPRRLAATPDGGVLVLSGDYLLTRLSGSGQVIWMSSARPVNANGSSRVAATGQVVVRPLAGNDFEIYMVGSVNNGGVTLDNDLSIIKLNSAGVVQWSKTYPTTNMTESVADAMISNDGALLLCGAAKGNMDNSPINAGASEGGLLVKVSPDGDILWARRSVPGTWSSLTQAPDGTIFTAGGFLPLITADIPPLSIGSYKPDGTLNQIVTISEADNNDKAKDAYAGFKDWLPDLGATPYDYGLKVVWTPAGLMAAGTTGLGAKVAPFTMLFSEKLSLRWCVTHEGGNVETVFDLAVTEGGVFSIGKSSSFGAGDNPAIPATVLMKLPFDGTVPLHPKTRSIVKYLQPSVYDFSGGTWDIDVPSPELKYEGTDTLTPGTAALNVVTGELPIFPYEPVAAFVTARLDRGTPSAPMTYEQWAAYQQIPGASMNLNEDGDGLTNYEEYLFGGTPWTWEPKSTNLFTLTRQPGGGGVRLQMMRSHAAIGVGLDIERSTDLLTWLPLGNSNAWELLDESRQGTQDLLSGYYILDIATAPGEAGFFRSFVPPAGP